jgi:nucleoside-diphosphate-sugar epimerase
MALHVVVGAGPIGSATARRLVADGHEVRLVTRRGGGPDHPAIERVAADATGTGRLTELARGAQAIYNCANPPYHRWAELWPPLASAFLTAAERSGAVLIAMSNLYGYGPVDGPMTEDLPLAPVGVKGGIRTRMWLDMLAAHEAGRVRVAEARASDYVGDGGDSIFASMIAPKVIAGRVATAPVNFDAPHTPTYPGDAARLLAVLGNDERAWGRPWHVPSPPPTTMRHLATRLAELAGAPPARLRRMPAAVLWLGGLFNPVAREFREVSYQFERPFVLDSSAAQSTFGLAPTPLDDALRTMVPRVPQSKSTAA